VIDPAGGDGLVRWRRIFDETGAQPGAFFRIGIRGVGDIGHGFRSSV